MSLTEDILRRDEELFFNDLNITSETLDNNSETKLVADFTEYNPLHNGHVHCMKVAKSQVGTTSGSKYWTWYGFNKKVNWCAIFVSWCANESGMLDSLVPKFSLCTDGENWYKKNNRWKDKSYVPMTGNIIFFDWQQDGHTDHVGIVEKVENGKVFTIEGNSKDEVREKSYNLNSKLIFGYGI